jgi:hypothetical protein
VAIATKTIEEPTKPQKETAEIRALLEAYPKCKTRIDNTEERLLYLELMQDSPSSSNLTGMPSGSRDGSSKQERDLIKKLELEERLRDMYEEENSRREEIENLIEQMDEPNEQTVIEMRYLDDASWRSISVALHGKLPDYDEHEERYLKRTFKIHGRALQHLARIYSNERSKK